MKRECVESFRRIEAKHRPNSLHAIPFSTGEEPPESELQREARVSPPGHLRPCWTLIFYEIQEIYLPRGSVAPEVAERVLEPIVDLVQRQLLLRGLDDGL